MNWKRILAYAGAALGLMAGEAIKNGYKEWHELAALTYWLGISVQAGSYALVYLSGLHQDRPGGLDHAATLLQKGPTP